MGSGAATRGTMGRPIKPLRRDAELNLARILVAARDVFAEHGYEASMEQIAARAEVGVGTLYRRFPNKADLFAAVVDAATDRTRQIADEVLRGGSGRGGLRVRPPLRGGAELLAGRHLAATLERRRGRPGPGYPGAAHRADPRSQPAGGHGPARHRPTDLVVTLMSVRALGDLCDADAPGASRRFLELALDGLRPGSAAPRAPSMSVKQLGRVLTDR